MVRMRSTKGKRNLRRSHHNVSAPTLTQEGEVMRRRHYGSRLTGLFRGKKVMDVKVKEKDVKTDEKRTSEEASVPNVG